MFKIRFDIKRAAQQLAGEFLPPVCSYCSRPLKAGSPVRGICADCLTQMPLLPPEEMRHFLPAQEEKYFNDSLPIYLFFRYEGPVRKAVTGLKFHDRTDFAEGLADLCALSWERRAAYERRKNLSYLDSVDAVVPLPLHAKRRRERTYNQAELLAAALCSRISLPCLPELSERKKYTLRQSETKSRGERLANVRDAFSLSEPAAVRGLHILLFDDVTSSGATLWAAARPFLRAGAQVSLAALAGNIREEAVDF